VVTVAGEGNYFVIGILLTRQTGRPFRDEIGNEVVSVSGTFCLRPPQAKRTALGALPGPMDTKEKTETAARINHYLSVTGSFPHELFGH
jgi:hypothetical protein